MRRIIIVLGLGLGMMSCSVSTSGNVDVDSNDIKYVRDSRTNLCFGIVASRKSFSTATTGLGVTCVPCESVKHLIK
jgi:hypothetical protein